MDKRRVQYMNHMVMNNLIVINRVEEQNNFKDHNLIWNLIKNHSLNNLNLSNKYLIIIKIIIILKNKLIIIRTQNHLIIVIIQIIIINLNNHLIRLKIII